MASITLYLNIAIVHFVHLLALLRAWSKRIVLSEPVPVANVVG